MKTPKETLITMLHEFCGDEIRVQMANPYYRNEHIYATDGKFLIWVDAETFGLTEKDFPKNWNGDTLKVESVFGVLKEIGIVPTEVIHHIVTAMEDYKNNVADIHGMCIHHDNLKKLDIALHMFGAEGFVLYTDKHKLYAEVTKDGRQAAIMLMMPIAQESSYEYYETDNVKTTEIDMERGLEYMDNYLDEKREREEEEKRRKKNVYLVPFVKYAYVPVYAATEKEARAIANDKAFVDDYEGDGDWELADYESDEMDAEDIMDEYDDGCWTAEGLVDWDELLEADDE